MHMLNRKDLNSAELERPKRRTDFSEEDRLRI